MRRQLAATLALLGRDEEAKVAAASLLEMDPQFRVSVFASWYPLRRRDDLDRLGDRAAASGIAGLSACPEQDMPNQKALAHVKEEAITKERGCDKF